jgi:hypothetical protein
LSNGGAAEDCVEFIMHSNEPGNLQEMSGERNRDRRGVSRL